MSEVGIKMSDRLNSIIAFELFQHITVYIFFLMVSTCSISVTSSLELTS